MPRQANAKYLLFWLLLVGNMNVIALSISKEQPHGCKRKKALLLYLPWYAQWQYLIILTSFYFLCIISTYTHYVASNYSAYVKDVKFLNFRWQMLIFSNFVQCVTNQVWRICKMQSCLPVSIFPHENSCRIITHTQSSWFKQTSGFNSVCNSFLCLQNRLLL